MVNCALILNTSAQKLHILLPLTFCWGEKRTVNIFNRQRPTVLPGANENRRFRPHQNQKD